MEQKYVSVTGLNKYLKAKFLEDTQLSNIYIKGEISNFKYHTSGHCYFTLKDQNSRINAVLFSSQARKINFTLEDGMSVLIEGSVSIYEVTGQYQLYVRSIILDGLGQLYLQFDQLKRKLENLGYFSPTHKKVIPKFPNKIGIITGANTAALTDILKVINKRFPSIEIYLFPTLVQGKQAALDIVTSIKKADSIGLDTLLLARGGGSIEDLWPFNEEIVALAVYEAKTPIISAIGHESDVVITDFIADVRAATPTAGASLMVPDYKELLQTMERYQSNLIKNIQFKIQEMKNQLFALSDSYIYKNPRTLYQEEFLRVSILTDSLNQSFYKFIQSEKEVIKRFQTSFDKFRDVHLLNYQNSLKEKKKQLLHTKQLYIKTVTNNYNTLYERFKAYSPLGVLKRGFTYVNKEETMITSSNQIEKDDIVEIVFYDGKKTAIIK